jgi:hypothetical protein
MVEVGEKWEVVVMADVVVKISGPHRIVVVV